MCYHEQLVFTCGCKTRNIYPCPRRLHLERASTVNWRRIHKLTRVCPQLEWDQLFVDIICEACSLVQQDAKSYATNFLAYANEHTAMYQRLLGKEPAYIHLLEPTWSWSMGRMYDRPDQMLRKRIIDVPGVNLFRTEYQNRQDQLQQWQQAAPWGFGVTNTAVASTKTKYKKCRRGRRGKRAHNWPRAAPATAQKDASSWFIGDESYSVTFNAPGLNQYNNPFLNTTLPYDNCPGYFMGEAPIHNTGVQMRIFEGTGPANAYEVGAKRRRLDYSDLDGPKHNSKECEAGFLAALYGGVPM